MIEKNDLNPSSHLLKLIASACTSSWKGLNHWKLPVRYLLVKARVEIEEKSKAKQKVSSFQFISTFLYLSLPFHCCVKEKRVEYGRIVKQVSARISTMMGCPCKAKAIVPWFEATKTPPSLHHPPPVQLHSLSLRFAPFELQISNVSNILKWYQQKNLKFNDIQWFENLGKRLTAEKTLNADRVSKGTTREVSRRVTSRPL